MVTGKKIGVIVTGLVMAVAMIGTIIFLCIKGLHWYNRGTEVFSITNPGVPNYEKFKDLFIKSMKTGRESVISSEKKHSVNDQKIIDKHQDILIQVMAAINYKKIFEGLGGDSATINLLSSQEKFREFNIKTETDKKTVEDAISFILSYAAISKQLVMSLDDIKKLSIIDLSGFKLNTLPSALEVFKGVKEISIPDAGIIGGVENLCNLDELEIINLKGNKLQKMPDLKGFKSLKKIDLSGNCIKTIDTAVLKEAIGDRVIEIYVVPRSGETVNPLPETFVKEHPNLKIITVN